MNKETLQTITRLSHVDQVGSLLRPQALKDAYARHGNGEIGDAELARIQNESVKALMAKQEAHGPSILTDGEYRQLNFQDSFVESVAGFVPKKQTIRSRRVAPSAAKHCSVGYRTRAKPIRLCNINDPLPSGGDWRETSR